MTMMHYIAHRGNVYGKNESYENDPIYVLDAINCGFHVEVDLWSDKNNKLFLGHDNPKWSIELDYLLKHRNSLWIHAKNIDAINFLSRYNFHWFWHENDTMVLTSKNIIWTFLETFIDNSIVNQPSDSSIFWEQKLYTSYQFLGICHDNIAKCKEIIEYV